MSTQWNRQLNRYVSKVIECLEQNIRNKDHQITNKWTDYKIFELKYGNTKLLGNTKQPGKVSTCSFFFCLFVPI